LNNATRSEMYIIYAIQYFTLYATMQLVKIFCIYHFVQSNVIILPLLLSFFNWPTFLKLSRRRPGVQTKTIKNW